MTDGTSSCFRRPAAQPGTAPTSIASKMADKGGFGIAGRDGHRGQGFQRARRHRIFVGPAGRAEDRHHHQADLRDRGSARARPQDRARLPGPAGQSRCVSRDSGEGRPAAEQVCYVGDDVIDLPVMRLCGLAIAVKNSRPEVLRESHYITPHEGGHGAVRDAIEYVLREQGSLERVMDEYIRSRAGRGSRQFQRPRLRTKKPPPKDRGELHLGGVSRFTRPFSGLLIS